jgi:hypothetical protein
VTVDVGVEDDADAVADVDVLGDVVLEEASVVRVLETDEDDDETSGSATLKPRLGDKTEAGLAWI